MIVDFGFLNEEFRLALDEVEDGWGGFFPCEGDGGLDDCVFVVAAGKDAGRSKTACANGEGVDFSCDAEVRDHR